MAQSLVQGDSEGIKGEDANADDDGRGDCRDGNGEMVIRVVVMLVMVMTVVRTVVTMMVKVVRKEHD